MHLLSFSASSLPAGVNNYCEGEGKGACWKLCVFLRESLPVVLLRPRSLGEAGHSSRSCAALVEGE